MQFSGIQTLTEKDKALGRNYARQNSFSEYPFS